eukprot:6389601-Pyramimonas_sp.AAC.1
MPLPSTISSFTPARASLARAVLPYWFLYPLGWRRNRYPSKTNQVSLMKLLLMGAFSLSASSIPRQSLQ